MKISVENGVVTGVAESLQDVQVLLTLGTEVKPKKQNGEKNGKKKELPHPILPGKLGALQIGENFFLSSEEWGRSVNALYPSVYSCGRNEGKKYQTRSTEGGWNITRIK